MLLGMGLTGLSSYGGYYPFANILWNANHWQRQSGTGDFTQEWGVLTAATGTDTFYCKFAEGSAVNNLPAGTYTVFNPDGLNIGVGWGGTPNITGWTTATEFTFTKTGAAVFALYAEGSVTNNNGPIQIILPGLRDAFLAGDYFNPDFITFLSGLNVSCLRFMDWLQTYIDVTSDWSEVPVGLPLLTTSSTTLQVNKMPYQLCVELANRLNIDPWINVPARASTAFMDALATYLRDHLNPGLQVYLEFGNEIWNPGGPYNDARVWTETYGHTRYTATSNTGINGWTRTAHGLVTGDIVSQFFSKDNYTYTSGTQVYPSGYGVGLYVEAVDANNFKLYSDVGRTTVVAPTANTPTLLYSLRSEAGKTLSVNTNYGTASLAMWNRFDAILGRGRCLHVLGTQWVTATGTTSRLAPTGVAAATDMVAGAPYYSGDWFVGAVTLASGQVTPKGWSHLAGTSMRVAVYANGSTPTTAEIMAAGGTGYINHKDLSFVSDDPSSYVSGAAITGLSNGTQYEAFVVFTGIFNDRWKATAHFTASATASTVAITDSNAAMAARARRRFTYNLGLYAPPQAAAAGSIPLVAYECGSDYFGGNTAITEVVAYRTSYTQSSEAGEVMRRFYRAMAARGLKLANQFTDIQSTPGVFNIAESFTDTSDPRYVAFANYAGLVPVSAVLSISDVVASDIAAEPSYPATVSTFANAALTYSIYSGDNSGNFSISSNQLRLANGTGINWSVSTSYAIVVEASDGQTSAFFTVSFNLGSLAAGGVAAPTLTGSPTLLASWDFADDTKITNVSGAVSAISGSDGTSFSLAGSGGSANPTITTSNGKQVATFASASSQKLDAAHASGITGACTMVMIVKVDSTTTGGLVEVARGTNSSSFDRLALLLSSSTGFQARQHDASGTQCIASVGSVPNTTDPHLVIGVLPNAAATTTSLNIDGQGTPLTGTPAANAASGLARTTIGSRRVASANDIYANVKVFRVLIYDGSLNATQKEEIAAWATTNYGTVNNA